MSDTIDLEQLEAEIEDLPDQDRTDLVKRLRSAYRQVKKERDKARADQAELARYKRAETVRQAGLESLTEAQISALVKVHEGDATPEAYRATAEALGWVNPGAQSDEQRQLTAEAQAHADLSQAATGAAAAPSGQLSPETVADWGADRMMAFAKKHPHEWERLKRGETVAVSE